MTRTLEKADDQFVEVPEEPKDQDLERFESLLETLKPNTTIVISRLQPSWCTGFLEEVTLSEAIGLDYFIDTWGGHQLSVKVRGKGGKLQGSHRLDLFSFPPLRWGEPIKQYQRSDRYKDQQETEQQNPSQRVVVNPPNPPNPFENIFAALPSVLPVIMEWIKAQDEKRNNERMMMMEMMKTNSGGLSDITKIGAVMTQLNEMFKQNSGTVTPDGSEMDFIPHALEVLKMAMAPKTTPPMDSPTHQRLTSPKKAPPPPPSPSPANVTPLRRDISSVLSEMDPDEAAVTVMEALGRMDAGKRESAMSSFESKMLEQKAIEDGYDANGDPYDDENNRGVQ